MSQLLNWRDGLCRWLSSGDALEKVDVVPEYAAARNPLPLRRPRLAVGFESLEAEHGGKEEYLGADGQGQGRAVRWMQAVLRLEILVPTDGGGGVCHAVWEALLERLLVASGDYQMERMWCGPLTYDRENGGYRLSGRAKVSVALTAPTEQERYDQVELRRKTI